MPKQTKLTEWKSEPTIEDISYEIKASVQEYNSLITKIEKRRAILAGESEFERKKGRSAYVPKIAKKQMAWRVSSLEHALLSGDKLFNVIPRGYTDKKRASQISAILDKHFTVDIDKIEFVGKMVRKASYDAIVFARVGWRKEEENVEMLEEEYEYIPRYNSEEEKQQLLAQVKSGEISEDDMFDKNLVGEKIVKEKRVVFNGPELSLIDAKDIMVSPLDKENTIAYHFKSTISDLKSTGDYPMLDNIDIDDLVENDSSETDFQNDEDTNDSYKNYENKSKKIINIYEVWTRWDINDNGELVPIVATYAGNKIIRLEENPFPHKKPPFVAFIYDYDDEMGVYGVQSDIDLLEDNQRVQGALMRGMIDLLGRSANSQIGYAANALDLTNQKRMMDGDDYIFNPGVDPSKAVYTHKFPDVPRSAMELLTSLNNEAEAMSGIKSFNSGINGNTFGDVATGIHSTVDAVSKREESILRRFGKSFEKIARMVLSMASVNLSDEEILMMQDDTSVEISRDIFDMDFDVNFVISTPEQKLKKANDLTMLMQTIGNSMGQDMLNIMLAEIAKLNNMPGLSKMIEEYEPKPDPLAEQRAQLELESMSAENQKNMAMAKYYEAQANLGGAKTVSEGAKAKVLEKDADNRDLDFVRKLGNQDLQEKKELADHQFELALGHKAADSLLSKDTPNNVHKNFSLDDQAEQNYSEDEDPGMTDAEDIGSEAIRR